MSSEKPWLEELEQAAKTRRESGTCGPYPTGEEMDVVAYKYVETCLVEHKMTPEQAAVETECSIDFVKAVQEDISGDTL